MTADGPSGGPAGPPRRVVVAHPRTLAARGETGLAHRAAAYAQAPPHGPQAEPAAGASHDDARLRALIGRQLRLGLGMIGALAALLLCIPLAFAAVPPLRDVRLGGIPVSWLVIAAALQPAFVALGVVTTRRAEAHETRYLAE